MRIITGTARGCRLKTPKGEATRPTFCGVGTRSMTPLQSEPATSEATVPRSSMMKPAHRKTDSSAMRNRAASTAATAQGEDPQGAHRPAGAVGVPAQHGRDEGDHGRGDHHADQLHVPNCT